MTELASPTLCLIPARGGSKGIPGKNLRACFGKPLIDFTIDTALELFSNKDIVVSSDDTEILAHASRRGIGSLPRPKFIAQDDTPMISVIQHAVMSTDYHYKNILLLQPTSPYRNVAEIRHAIEMLETEDADLIVSVSAVPQEISPYLMLKIEDGKMVPLLAGPIPTSRQEAPRAYMRNGQFYFMRAKHVAYGNNLYGGKVLAFETSDSGVNLDTEDDWTSFERLQAAKNAS